MPLMAASKTPSRSTALSCVSRRPSRWMLKKKREVGAELVQPLLGEHAVGAEVDVLAALEDAGHQGADLGVDHRLAAADAHDGGAGLVHGIQALLDGEAVLEVGGVFADAPAAGAGEVAGVQRLEHQHEREARRAGQLVLGHVADHVGRQAQGESHGVSVQGLVRWYNDPHGRARLLPSHRCGDLSDAWHDGTAPAPGAGSSGGRDGTADRTLWESPFR